METYVIGSYIVGTVFGLVVGYNSGIRKGATTMLETLVDNNFVKHRKNRDGNIEIMSLDEEVTE